MATITVCDQCGTKTDLLVGVSYESFTDAAGSTDWMDCRIEFCGGCFAKLVSELFDSMDYPQRKATLIKLGFLKET